MTNQATSQATSMLVGPYLYWCRPGNNSPTIWHPEDSVLPHLEQSNGKWRTYYPLTGATQHESSTAKGALKCWSDERVSIYSCVAEGLSEPAPEEPEELKKPAIETFKVLHCTYTLEEYDGQTYRLYSPSDPDWPALNHDSTGWYEDVGNSYVSAEFALKFYWGDKLIDHSRVESGLRGELKSAVANVKRISGYVEEIKTE